MRLRTALRRISQRAGGSINPLPLELKQIVEQRRAQGLPVYDFGIGELDGELPSTVGEAAADAIARGDTGYGPAAGLPALRSAVLGYLGCEQECSVENVVIANGASNCLLQLFITLCEIGDTVLVPPAAREDFVSLARLAGAEPVSVGSADQSPSGALRVTRNQLISSLEKHDAKAFVLSNPCSPTGQVYSAEEVAELARVCADFNVFFLLDRRFWKIMFKPEQFPEPKFDDQSRAWVIQIDSLSNAFPRCSGLRVGWCVAPADVTEALSRLQARLHGSASSLSQEAALRLLEEGVDPTSLQALSRKLARWRELTEGIPGVRPLPTQGTFYSLWDVSEALTGRGAQRERLASGDDLAELLLERYGVVSTPGSCYGLSNYLRFSFSVPDAVLTSGAAAIRSAFEELAR